LSDLQTVLKKEIQNGRMLKKTGSWMYCDSCNKTVGYLCYSTYRKFTYKFICSCGTKGLFKLDYPDEADYNVSEKPLLKKKNRLCCPNDESPLFTCVEKHLKSSHCIVICKSCQTQFTHNI